MRLLICTLAVCALIVSGCTESSAPTETGAPAAGTILVEDGEGGQVAVNVTNETGAVLGQVLSDAGFGLPGARLTVIGAERGATTNETGWFQVTSVPPGKRLIRAEHDNYRTSENEIEVEAGRVLRVTITLVPPIDGEAGYRPHLHDYWAGREDVLVIDHDFPYFSSRSPEPSRTFSQAAKAVLGSTVSERCLPSADRKYVSSYASQFHFPDPQQTVWPGTQRIEITPSWSASDYNGPAVGIVWRAPNATTYTWSNAVQAGKTLAIEVEAAMWDPAHHAFSLWEFYLCKEGHDERPTGATGTVFPGRVFSGKYHIQMTLFKGTALAADQPHPRFWQNGSQMRVVDGWRNISCVNGCTAGLDGRGPDPANFAFDPLQLVPPGTGKVVATLQWQYSAATGTKPLSTTYAPASVPPHEKTDLTKYKAPKAEVSGAGVRKYVIVPAPGETDAFYQTKSNWRFVWGNEGEEADGLYLQTCGCTLSIHLVVEVQKDPDYR